VADPVRYYFDQNIQAAVAAGVRRHGIDVVTAQDAGRCGFPDPDQLAFATAAGRVVVTFDPDYIALHTSGASHAGIAWAPSEKYTIGQLISTLLLVHGVYTADDMLNRLEYL
jgi:predicted nuclease of predicted toxin-antitoxin system